MRFNRIIRLLPVLLILLLPLTGCEYSDTELVLKGKLDVTGVENGIHGPVIVGVANTDDLEYIMANPQDSVAIMVPVETLDYRFNIDLSDTSLKAGDTVTVFAFADNNYNGGIPMPDAGDLFGMYIDESSFATTVTLNKGSTYVEFAPDKGYYEHDASITFEITEGDITLDDGDNIIIVVIHNDGVTKNLFGIPTGIKDISYAIAFDQVTYHAGDTYTIPVLPAIKKELEKDGELTVNPFRVNNVYLFAIRDNNLPNGKPDTGESLGYYYGLFPRQIDISEEDENNLTESVRFSNETY